MRPPAATPARSGWCPGVLGRVADLTWALPSSLGHRVARLPRCGPVSRARPRRTLGHRTARGPPDQPRAARPAHGGGSNHSHTSSLNTPSQQGSAPGRGTPRRSGRGAHLFPAACSGRSRPPPGRGPSRPPVSGTRRGSADPARTGAPPLMRERPGAAKYGPDGPVSGAPGRRGEAGRPRDLPGPGRTGTAGRPETLRPEYGRPEAEAPARVSPALPDRGVDRRTVGGPPVFAGPVPYAQVCPAGTRAVRERKTPSGAEGSYAERSSDWGTCRLRPFSGPLSPPSRIGASGSPGARRAPPRPAGHRRVPRRPRAARSARTPWPSSPRAPASRART